MANNSGRFLIDESVDDKTRQIIIAKNSRNLEAMKTEIDERRPIIEKRQDFYEGRHHKWTNVTGQAVKQQEGHILAVFNYINRMAKKVEQTLSNKPPKVKILSGDESNEVETARAQAVEEAIYSVLKENKFFLTSFKRSTNNQVRDGDFLLECKVMEENGQKRVVLGAIEDLLKVSIGWDDAAGTSFSFIAFSDQWTTSKIKREFDYDAEAISENQADSSSSQGSHINNNQYGTNNGIGLGSNVTIPTGKNKLPKANISDIWSYEIIDGEVKVVNLIFINSDCVQFIVTDYKKIPRFPGHSLVVAGKPWSMGFIDNLIDPQIELNDRTSEEGDLIRIGSHMKFLAVNMPDFDPSSVKPGSGQVIFIEGENVDFRPLQMSITPFPSESYLNRVQEHLYSLGIPKIALAAGTAPYTGKVGAIQYQPFADLIDDLRGQFELPFGEIIKTIQEYFIDYFPETHAFMRESIDDGNGGFVDGELKVREVEFDWDNVLPLSRSDKVVDASTMRDRGALSLSTYLAEAGFRDPEKEIKKMRKEYADPDLVTLQSKFSQFSPGAVKAQADAQRVQQEQQMVAAEEGAAANFQAEASKPSVAPILSQDQNDGRRGIPTGSGTPNGQTATKTGFLNQLNQNMKAKEGA